MSIGKATIVDVSDDVIGKRIESLIEDVKAARASAPGGRDERLVEAVIEGLRAAEVAWSMTGMKSFVPPSRVDPHITKTADVMLVDHEARFMSDVELVEKLDTLDVAAETRETAVGWLAIARQRLGFHHPAYLRVFEHIEARVRREEPADMHEVTIASLRKL